MNFATLPALHKSLLLIVSTMALTACGGGGSSSASSNTGVSSPVLAQEPGAPVFIGNTATDGFNWFNYRRAQTGLPQLTRNSQIDLAAQNHSDYQRINNTITHSQTQGLQGYTGTDLLTRLRAVGYNFAPQSAYAYGEVISSTSDSSGFYMAEELITAIYHRFVILEPTFKEAGSGAAVGSNGSYFFTTDFATNNGYGAGVGAGKIAVYPFADQQRVPTVFYSDYESPDPVPSRNEVGYPVSVHANINVTLSVQKFTITPRGGSPLAVQLLTNPSDRETPRSAAAIIPIATLTANTLYDVEFVGTADGTAISRKWSFRTR